jgi:hypothetical protein
LLSGLGFVSSHFSACGPKGICTAGTCKCDIGLDDGSQEEGLVEGSSYGEGSNLDVCSEDYFGSYCTQQEQSGNGYSIFPVHTSSCSVNTTRGRVCCTNYYGLNCDRQTHFGSGYSISPVPAKINEGYGEGSNLACASERPCIPEKQVKPAAAVAIAGRETYVVGLYLPRYVPEVHEILVVANENEGYYLDTKPPSGTYELRLGNTSIGILSQSSSAYEVRELFKAIEYFGPVDVLKRREIISGEQTDRWTITYLDLRGRRDVPMINASTLLGGFVTMGRVQEGVALSVQWQMKLNGRVSEKLWHNSSEIEVEQAILTAFPDVLSAAVIAVQNKPGRLLDRTYPRQWTIKIVRQEVAGIGKDRCTNPLYVDWDPTACPHTAADLFLNFYPWYYPALLPTPADLGTNEMKTQMLEKCLQEARSNGLRSGACQARIPSESLPICGEGSGINPPCWTKRFTSAKVTHASSGEEIIYERDDSRAPSAGAKGYRFWMRPDIEQLRKDQMLALNHSVMVAGSGMDVRKVFERAQEVISCEISDKNYTTMKVIAPLLPGANVAEIVESDFIFRPTRVVSFSPAELNVFDQDEVSFGHSVAFNGDVARLAPRENSKVSFPLTVQENSEQFTVEMWVKVNQSRGVLPLLQVASKDSGFAIILSRAGWWQFYLADGNKSSPAAMPVSGFSVVSGVASINRWSHVAISFDGTSQQLFIDGTVYSTPVQGYRRISDGGTLQFSGSCGSWLEGACGQDSQGIIELDEALFYNVALPVSLLREHDTLLRQTLHASLKVSTAGGLFASCTGECALKVLSSKTPRVWDVTPNVGWDGRSVTIFGEGLTLAPLTAVHIGNGLCESVLLLSDTQLSCIARAPTTYDLPGPVHVTFAGLGRSISAVSFQFVSTIETVTQKGSRMGGTSMSITGFGIVDDAERMLVLIGGEPCKIRSVSQGTPRGLVCVSPDVMPEHSLDGLQLKVELFVDGRLSLCQIKDGCHVTLSADVTPELDSLQVSPPGKSSPVAVSDGSTLTIVGSKFPSSGALEITMDDIPCLVTQRSPSQLMCTVGLGSGGRRKLRVRFDVGIAAGSADHCCNHILYDVTVLGIQPSNEMISAWGGNVITLTGTGFSPKISDHEVFLGQNPVRVLTSTHSTLVFEAPSSGSLPWPSTQNFSLALDSVTAVCEGDAAECRFSYTNGPLINDITPTSGTTGTTLTISGSGFETNCPSNSVFIGEAECTIQSCGATSLECIVGSSPSGSFPVQLTVSGSPAISASNVLNPPLSQRSSSPNPIRTSSMLEQTSYGGAWIAAQLGDWLEIDAGRPMTITGFITQARGASYCTGTCGTWVKTAKISYRLEADGSNTEMSKIFDCNVVGDVLETISNFFPIPIFARFVRITPVSCRSGCSMRAGLLTASHTVPKFSIPISISAISPTAGGFGGSYQLTITGLGFHNDKQRLAVTLCGFPCVVLESTLTKIRCNPTQGFVDMPSVPLSSAIMETSVKRPEDDATQDTVSNTLILSRYSS